MPAQNTLNSQHERRATSVEFGVQSIAPPLFGGTSPDFIVTGPNVGSNLGSTVLISGTV